MIPLIAIVNSSSFGKLFPEHLERLHKFAEIKRLSLPSNIEAKDLIREIKGCHGIITSVSPRYTTEVFQALPELVVISRHGIGFDNVDVRSATQCGVCVSRVPGAVEQEAVAEHAITLMLSASRQVVQARDAVLKGHWSTRAQYIGIELRGKRIGIIGLGNVGRRISEILTKGFNAEVVAFDPFLKDEDFISVGAKRVTFHELITTCSIVSLNCSLNDSNLRCLGEKEFSIMKKGVILINTARGELIDEQALIRAIKSGFVSAYASDVVEGAPVNSEHQLLKQPNVILLPHLGAYTIESLRGMGETMVRHMEQVFVEDVFPENLVDREITQKGLKKWNA